MARVFHGLGEQGLAFVKLRLQRLIGDGQLVLGDAGGFLEVRGAVLQKGRDVAAGLDQILAGGVEDLMQPVQVGGKSVLDFRAGDSQIGAGASGHIFEFAIARGEELFELVIAGDEERLEFLVHAPEGGRRGFKDLRRMAGALRDQCGELIAGRGQRIAEVAAIDDDGVVHALAGVIEALDQRVAAVGNRLRHAHGGGVDALAQHACAGLQLHLDGFGAFRDRRGELGRGVEQAHGERFARIRQPGDEAIALNAEGADHLLAGDAQLPCDLFGLAFQGGVDLGAGLVHMLGDARARLDDLA